MNIVVSTFCGIATSPTWQTWLYEQDNDLYTKFMAQLKESKGCGQNREIMKGLLTTMQEQGYTEKLEAFLTQKFPAAMGLGTPPKPRPSPFPDYVPGMLTFPHREIIEADADKPLQQKISEFMKGKGRSDIMIVNGKAYIEYLLPGEEPLNVPGTNWLLKEYRKNMTQVPNATRNPSQPVRPQGTSSKAEGQA